MIWSPAGLTRHRSQPQTEAQHRVAMVELAIAGNDDFRLDKFEAESGEPSYTVNLLEHLRAEYDDTPLVLLLGADAFLGLPTWHRWEELFELAHIAIFTRPGHELSIDAMSPLLGKQFAKRAAVDPARLGAEVDRQGRRRDRAVPADPAGYFGHGHPRPARARRKPALPVAGSRSGLYSDSQPLPLTPIPHGRKKAPENRC